MSRMVSDYLCESDMLDQLAQECSELSQAAEKLAMSLRGTNPPRVPECVCRDMVTEELADVQVCLDALGLVPDTTWMTFKRDRWLRELEERYGY